MSNGSSSYLNAVFDMKLVSLWSPLHLPALRKRVGLFQSWQEEQARSWRCCQVLSLACAVLGQIPAGVCTLHLVLLAAGRHQRWD